MATVTEQDRTALRALFQQYLGEHGEKVSAVLVEALTNVGMGYLIQSFGLLPPISRKTEREQLAAHLVVTYLQGTRPSPNNNYLNELRQVAQSYLASVDPQPPVPAAVVPILATLGMGATKETDPRPTRVFATVKFVDLYLAGR